MARNEGAAKKPIKREKIPVKHHVEEQEERKRRGPNKYRGR